MKYAPGTMVRLSHRIVIESQDAELDLQAGDTAIIMGEETVVFDPEYPDNSTETLYNCLVRGRIEQLFEIDFEVVNR
ncbi:MAG TPA: hypothetical protein EYG51_16815 [Pseudomonadales bacterium]|nr:hypothetical protein [Pseudomonadales bacterium]